jgi:hypothetical protein
MRHTFLVLVSALVLLPLPARSAPDELDADPGATTGREPRTVDMVVPLQTYVVWKSDADFDGSRAAYEPDGQSVGVALTWLKPEFTWNVRKNLRLFYEFEAGLEVWSRNNPDQQDPKADDVFLLKQRQIYAEGELGDGRFGFKVGYQYFQDPSRLFLAHWIGAAQGWFEVDGWRTALMIGQIPDPTYEGIPIDANNFTHDTFVGALTTRTTFLDFVNLSAGVYGLWDAHVIGQTDWALSPSLNLEADLEVVKVGLDLMGQFGGVTHAAAGGGDQTTLAWAAQLYGSGTFGKLVANLNVLALSPDDAEPVNAHNGAFHYSAKNRSPTLLFTENDIRDTFDNYDEKMSTQTGGFYRPRAGFVLTDVKVGYEVLPGLVPSLLAAYGADLQKKNALGSANLGWEFDAEVAYAYDEVLEARLVGGVLVPGAGLAANVNAIDLGATEPVWMIASSLLVRY